MSLLHRLLYRATWLFGRRRKEAELEEEMRAHLAMQAEAHVAAGMSVAQARREAVRQLGGVVQAQEACRDEYQFVAIEGVVREVRHGLRGLLKRPGFVVVAVATLALGIGASTAVFCVVETVMLRPLPFPNPQELATLDFQIPETGATGLGCSVPELEELQGLRKVFSDVSMVFPMDGNLTGVSEPQRVEALAVSPNYFRLLGLPAAIGRTFGPEEAAVPGWAPGCVISHAAWMNYFGGDPAIIGREFLMDYDRFRVIGVMPAGFRHPGRILSSNVDVWFTGGLRTAPFPATPDRDYRIIPGVIGRLAHGVAPGAAQARVDEYAKRARADYPRNYVATERWGPRIRMLQAVLTAEVRQVLWLLLGAVLLVLVICCATVANLMLVRATARRQEIALRCALGATRSTIVRQLLIEALLVATAGGAGGLAVAWVLSPLLLSMAPVTIPLLNRVTVNGPVVGFAVLVSAGTCLLFGLAPALRATRLDLVADLKSGGRTAGVGSDAQRWRATLVASQVALSLMLLVGAGLLFRSFLRAWRTHPGFDSHQLVVGRIWLPPPSAATSHRTYLEHGNRAAVMRELVRRFREIPGVVGAAVASEVPVLDSGPAQAITVATGGHEASVEGAAATSLVTPDYFRTLGISLLRGRTFTDADDGGNAVVIVNQALANRYWPGHDPVGRRLGRGTGSDCRWSTVVGVVADTKADGLDAPVRPRIYLPEYQESWLGIAFFVRTSGVVAESLTSALRREIHAADPDLPAYGLTTMEQIMSRSLARRRFLATVIGTFAGGSLLLAAIGIYGVIALTVSHRTKEIGVRIALGASRRQITAMVLRHGLVISTWGIGVGAIGAVAATVALRSLLYETQPLDPLVWIAIGLLLLAITTLACWMPARRAASVEPMIALRAD
jgi:predicted permease